MFADFEFEIVVVLLAYCHWFGLFIWLRGLGWLVFGCLSISVFAILFVLVCCFVDVWVVANCCWVYYGHTRCRFCCLSVLGWYWLLPVFVLI